MMPQQIPDAAIVIVTVLAMLGVGFWSMRRTKDVGDSFLDGHTFDQWMRVCVYGTVCFSTVLCVGYTGKRGGGSDGMPLADAMPMLVPLIVVSIVSLLTPPPSARLITKAFADPLAPVEVQEEVVA